MMFYVVLLPVRGLPEADGVLQAWFGQLADGGLPPLPPLRYQAPFLRLNSSAELR